MLECANKETDEVPAKLLESSLRMAMSEEDLKHDVTPPIHCDDTPANNHDNGITTRKLSFSNAISLNTSPQLRISGAGYGSKKFCLLALSAFALLNIIDQRSFFCMRLKDQGVCVRVFVDYCATFCSSESTLNNSQTIDVEQAI